jgi:hypothetical protein
MRPSDRLSIRLMDTAAARPPVSDWPFRLVQLTVLLIAIWFADAHLNGGAIRHALAEEGVMMWQAVLARADRFGWL